MVYRPCCLQYIDKSIKLSLENMQNGAMIDLVLNNTVIYKNKHNYIF